MNGCTDNKGWDAWLVRLLELAVDIFNDSNINITTYNLATAALSNSPPPVTHAHQHTQHTAIADTGASDHYFTSAAPILHINPSAPRTTIRTATGELQLSTATAQLGIPAIPTQNARTGHIMPGFTHNLLSLGKLCDADCTAYLNKHHLLVRDKDGNAILHGVREPSGAQLWRVDISAWGSCVMPTGKALALSFKSSNVDLAILRDQVNYVAILMG